MKPDNEMQRRILEAKLRQLQAQGYEWTVNAAIAEAAGEPADKAKDCEKKARAHYAGARRVKQMLDELPEPEETAGPEAPETADEV